MTQFWQPIVVLGVSMPIIVYALIISALAIPLYLLALRGRKPGKPQPGP